jgi:small neutral amino acid transporter SnatA (MarC family)
LFGVNYAAIRYLKEQKAISEEEAEQLEAGKVVPVAMPDLVSGKTMSIA